jgi:hypothetical protein
MSAVQHQEFDLLQFVTGSVSYYYRPTFNGSETDIRVAHFHGRHLSAVLIFRLPLRKFVFSYSYSQSYCRDCISANVYDSLYLHKICLISQLTCVVCAF